jgi:hypothetical protein
LLDDHDIAGGNREPSRPAHRDSVAVVERRLHARTLDRDHRPAPAHPPHRDRSSSHDERNTTRERSTESHMISLIVQRQFMTFMADLTAAMHTPIHDCSRGACVADRRGTGAWAGAIGRDATLHVAVR